MNFLFLLPGAFLAPIIHEWVKARVSAAMGDPTPKKNGFLTWNPLKYFEPIGFFMMMYFQVGWGRPVPTSPFYYKNKRKGIALTYITPMVANLLIGMIAIAIAVRLGAVTAPVMILFHFGTLNIRLAVFNLIPVFPMAMNKLLHIFISPEASMKLNHYEKPLQIFLFLLLIFGVLERIISPIANIFMRAVMF